jgi:ABC-type phosphate transport system substrate-binding protein
MSAFKQSVRKLGVRAGLLAVASAAVLATAGVSAGSAMATGPPTCPNGTTIAGRGSSLQKIAQLEVWNPEYNAACGNSPKVTYESTGSGPGLEAFRFTGTATEVNHAFKFIGTDDAPSREQIEHAEEVSGTPPAIVPVTQTAIAVVINPPAGCEFEEGTGITWTELNEVFGGNGITNWDEFEALEENPECNEEITRVVRFEGSGTTFQFKNYLQVLHAQKGAAKLPCLTEGTEEWEGLEKVGAPPAEAPNTVWPKCLGGTEVKTAKGGGAVAELVNGTPGAIGYAALPDAKSKGAKVAPLQNGTAGGSPTFAEPGRTTGVVGGKEVGTARCENARYEVPEEGQITGTGVAVDWSKVFGAQPSIGGEEYPLCTLTYDIGWLDYTAAGYEGAHAAEWQAAVKDYLENYVTPEAEGQADLAAAGKWYSALPVGEGSATASDVQEAAEYAAMRIGMGTGFGALLPAGLAEEKVLPTGGGEIEGTVTNNGSPNIKILGVDTQKLQNAEVTTPSACSVNLVLAPTESCKVKVHSTNALTASGSVVVTYSVVFGGITFKLGKRFRIK